MNILLNQALAKKYIKYVNLYMSNILLYPGLAKFLNFKGRAAKQMKGK